MLNQVVNEGNPFNWLDFLSQQLIIHVTNAKNPPTGKKAIFYMSAYLLDTICARNSFPGMNWAQSPREKVIQIYSKILSECSYKGVVGNLTDHFLIPLYKLIFEEEPPCMSRGEMEAVSELVDWFASLDVTFLRVFGG